MPRWWKPHWQRVQNGVQNGLLSQFRWWLWLLQPMTTCSYCLHRKVTQIRPIYDITAKKFMWFSFQNVKIQRHSTCLIVRGAFIVRMFEWIIKVNEKNVPSTEHSISWSVFFVKSCVQCREKRGVWKVEEEGSQKLRFRIKNVKN